MRANLERRKIIDLATLTGAVSVALGTINVAILGNNQAFTDEVREAAREVGERFWELPMDDDYREMIKSDIADIKTPQGGTPARLPRYFLREFAEDTPGYTWTSPALHGKTNGSLTPRKVRRESRYEH